MKIVLTICSANYLAHAKTLGDSLREHNPDFHFVIGLVDRLPKELKPLFWHPYELLPVEAVGIPALADMVERYDVVELNTAVKPFYIEHLYARNPNAEAVIYLDPDILVCDSFKAIEEKLRVNNLIVTPHSCTFDDTATNLYYEMGMVSKGIYNLGFLATSRSDTTTAFLKWWQKRLECHCYYENGSGLFVDQLWMTLAPLYFPGVYVEKEPGYNMCYWNHFERRLSRQNGRYVVNGKFNLVFYHFSSYDPQAPGSITKRKMSKVSSFSERPDLRPIYDDYRHRLLENEYASVKAFKYVLRSRPPKSEVTGKKFLKKSLKTILRSQPFGFQTFQKRIAQFILDSLK